MMMKTPNIHTKPKETGHQINTQLLQRRELS